MGRRRCSVRCAMPSLSRPNVRPSPLSLTLKRRVVISHCPRAIRRPRRQAAIPAEVSFVRQTDLDDIGHQPKDCKVGDRFEIEFDFVGKQAIAFYNGQRLGLITNELPDSVYPSLCLAFIGEKVETTKFEITYK